MTNKQRNFLLIAVLLVAMVSALMPRKKHHKFSYTTFQGAAGWGYNILVDGQLMIHQEIVPVHQMQCGFADEEKAAKAARLVIQKMKDGRPPSLTEADLKPINHFNNN